MIETNQDRYSKKEIETDLKRFKIKSGYDCNLKKPKTYLEKITYTKIFDRNPLITLTADKLKVRDFVLNIIGDSFKKHLTKIYFIIKKYKYGCIPEIEKPYVLKVNNASGRLKTMGAGKLRGNKKKVIHEKIKNWFNDLYGKEKCEWAYKNITPMVFGEELIYENKKLPAVYRFITFHGKVEYIEIYKYKKDFKRKFETETVTTYNKNFKLLNIQWNKYVIGKEILSKDTKEMLKISEKICKNRFNHCRVDFLVTDSTFYLSELTHYPLSGAGIIEPHEFDIELGSKWKL